MNNLTKITIALFTTINLLIWSSIASAQDMTTKRRPDNAEFVTETQVRLTTESVTVPKVQQVTEDKPNSSNFWDQIKQSFQDFFTTIRDIFK